MQHTVLYGKVLRTGTAYSHQCEPALISIAILNPMAERTVMERVQACRAVDNVPICWRSRRIDHRARFRLTTPTDSEASPRARLDIGGPGQSIFGYRSNPARANMQQGADGAVWPILACPTPGCESPQPNNRDQRAGILIRPQASRAALAPMMFETAHSRISS